MSVDGWSASNFVESSGAYPSPPFPVSMCAWYKPTAFTVIAEMCVLYASATPTHYQVIYVSTAAHAIAETGGTATRSAIGASTLSSGTWVHLGASFKDLSTRIIYLNGVSDSSNLLSATAVSGTFNRFRLGLGASGAKPALGAMREIALWNINLAATDFVELAAGLSPLACHPEALIAYYDLIDPSKIIDLMQPSANVAITGTLTANTSDPTVPIVVPRKRRLIVPPPLVTAGVLQDLAHTSQFQPIMAT